MSKNMKDFVIMTKLNKSRQHAAQLQKEHRDDLIEKNQRRMEEHNLKA